jgi:hypothetical protein
VSLPLGFAVHKFNENQIQSLEEKKNEIIDEVNHFVYYLKFQISTQNKNFQIKLNFYSIRE